MATRLLTVVFLLCGALPVLGGCAADEDLLFIGYNAFADPQQQCEINAQLQLPWGRLDVADTYPSDPLVPGSTPVQNPKSYHAFFLLRTNAQKNESVTNTGRGTDSVYNYGGLPSTDILVEEAEIQYVFSYNTTQPAGATLDAIPGQLVLPVNAWVGPETRAGKTGLYMGTAFLAVELISTTVGNALGADPDLYESLQYPNSYQMEVQVRARGHSTGGMRVQTGWTGFPITLCRNCMVSNPNCFDSAYSCYPPWQDC